jgi:outer membrane protein
MKKSSSILVATIVSIVSSFLISFCVVKYFNPKAGYVLIGEVFEKFEYKKEMQKKFELTFKARKRIIDSLEINLNYLAKDIKTKSTEEINNFEKRKMEYFQRKRLFEEDNQALTEQYDKEVISQLNQYIKDFGTSNGYSYIYGSDGNGSLMFAEEKNNVTAKVIDFVNKKYKGKS